MKCSRKLAGFVIVALSAQTGWAQVGDARISGTVVDELGNALSGAAVLYNRITTFAKDTSGRLRPVSPYVSDSAQSGPDGRFSISGLLAGEYYVCAQASTPGVIGSCEWNQPNPRILLVTGGAADLTLRVRSGIKVSIHVADQRGSSAKEPTLLIGVMSRTGYYSRAERTVSHGPLRVYTVTVPANQEVSLFVHADSVVSDNEGRAIANGQRSIPINTSTGRSEVRLDLVLRWGGE